ncbi:unnamed protein product [Trichobilharzia szidati]|nr:unnamed protein product [Trichobilharzia szidati]
MLSHQSNCNQVSEDNECSRSTTGENSIESTSSTLISDILDELSDDVLKSRLQSILLSKESELLESQSAYKHAQNEINESKKQLTKLELELVSVKRAAEMLIAEHDDALSTLKKQYDEELSSLLMASEQGYLHQYAEDQHLNDSSYSPSENCETRKSSVQSVEKKSAQSLANQAFDKMEKLVRRVSHKALTNNFILNKSSVSSILSNQELCPSKEDRLRAIIEPYETEISRLQQILINHSIPFNATASHPDSPAGSCKLSDDKNSSNAFDSSTRWDALTTTSDTKSNSTPENCATMKETSTPNTNDNINDNISISGYLGNNEERSDNHLTKQFMCNNAVSFEEKTYLTEAVENLEKQLASMTNELNVKTQALKVATDRRLELENALKTQVAEQASNTEKISTLASQMTQRLDGLMSNYKSYREATERELATLKVERKIAESNLETIRSHYDSLIGRRSQAAAELSRQPIQLPNEKDELEHLALKLYEENLSFREARDHLEERLKSETEAHKEQLAAEHQERLNFESSVIQELEDARKQLANLTNISTERDNEVALRQKFEEEAKSSKSRLNELQAKYELTESNLAEAQKRIIDLQDQVGRLQNDLDNVESVQADFVRLSQSLQVQLERLRQQDQEVRWVNPDDVTNCFGCNFLFPTGIGSGSKKINCRHCGKVHCSACMKNTMPAGPFGHAAVVCDVCHTLLNKNIAPYFSSSTPSNNSHREQSSSSSPRRFSLSSMNPQSPVHSSSTNLAAKPS